MSSAAKGWIAFVVMLLWIASVVAVGRWQNKAGHTAEKAAWQARENKELVAANASILRLEEAARAQELKKAEELDVIAKNHQKEIANEKRQKDTDVAAARSGALVLRIPSPCQGAGGDQASPASAGAGLSDGGATAELPREITANLFALADDADAVVRQLGQCQAVIRSDRSP